MNTPLNRNFLLLLILALIPLGNTVAHPGHADPVTISRSTHADMQKLVPHYLIIQKGLAAGEVTGAVKDAADAIRHIVKKARKKESDSSGKKMYKGVAKTAGFIHSAADLKTAREEFDELNNILMPFFDNWPSHIQEHDLILYTCKETTQWWLQHNEGKAADPYRGAEIVCDDLIEKEG